MKAGWKRWVDTYPDLREWNSEQVSVECVHAELSMSLNLRQVERPGPEQIVMSKNPCFLCEEWFGALRDKSGNKIRYTIAPGHGKVY
jgi:hypothetical protein